MILERACIQWLFLGLCPDNRADNHARPDKELKLAISRILPTVVQSTKIAYIIIYTR